MDRGGTVLVPPKGPGLGIEVDREAARCARARWLNRPHLYRLDGSFTNW